MTDPVACWVLRFGDHCLILGQRLSEWCGHAPALEEDIAMANTALDLIGQARMWLELAGRLEGKNRSADHLAFLRDAREYSNFLIVERPNTDMAYTLIRQVCFDTWHRHMLEQLCQSSHADIRAIVGKALKEVSYHWGRSRDLVIRLGKGSEDSHSRMQAALDALWPYTGELLEYDALDRAMAEQKIGPDVGVVGGLWQQDMQQILKEATLIEPEDTYRHSGGREGLHTEAFGFLLAEMSCLQRTYPGAQW